MRFFFIFLFFIASSLFSAVSSAQISIDSITRSTEEGKLSINLTGRPVYYWFTLKKPERLVIDIKKVSHHSFRLPSLNGFPLKGIRWNKRDKNTMRFVFDLKESKKSFDVEMRKARKKEAYRLEVIFQKHSTTKKHIATMLPKPNRDIVVVIDAGHGGKDPGAIGYRRLQEKIITLKIAKKTAAIINQKSGIKAILTRTGDHYISLRGRTNIARKKKADIFISIHANSLKTRRTRGAMIFVLSRRGASSEMGRWLENRENNDSLIGGIDGIDLGNKSDRLAKILLDLSISNTTAHSILFANKLIDQFKSNSIRLHSKKVEKAAFVVLKSPDIPSVLLETGFITTPSDARLLNSGIYQTKLARTISQAIINYFSENPPAGTKISQQINKKQNHITHYKVKKGDTLSAIASRFNVSVSQLIKINRISSSKRINVGQVLKIHGELNYKVKPGDTLSDIADRFKVKIDRLAQANEIKNKSHLIVGKIIKIPY